MSRAKRVVLHVGTMKSGTSYLQSILRRNSTGFASNGILIPHRMVAAAADALGNKGKNRVMDIRGEWQRVLSDIEAWQGDQVIASHEFLGAASQAQAVAVVESLRPHDVEIVVSARDLLRVIPSHWQTTVKSARTIAFPDYVALLLGERPTSGPEEERLLTGFWQHHDVSRVVRTWAGAAGVGAVTLVTVPPSGADPVLLWERFAAACHVEPRSYDAAPDSESNVSLSFSETEMLRQVNQELAGKMSPRQYRVQVNNRFANGLLRDLRTDATVSDRPRLTSEQRLLVANRATELIESLEASGVRIIGDLADLHVDASAGEGDEPSVRPQHEVPDFAVTVIARLLLDRVNASTEGAPAASLAPGRPEELARSDGPARGRCRVTSAQDAPAAPPRPNVVLILADDLGWSDIGCYGAEIATPNIDRLAEGGRRFTQMYNNCRCSPTRASLLTGLYPTQTGIGLLTQNQGFPEYQGFLNRRCVTLGELLQPAGYQTSVSGKWHVAGNRQQRSWPHARGFDESYCGLGGNGYYTTEQYRNGQLIGISEDPDFHFTDATTAHAVETISRFSRSDAPFFSYVAYNAPHFPLHAREEDIAPYRGEYVDGWETIRRRRYEAGIARGVIDPSWALPPPDPDAEVWPAGKDVAWQDGRMAAYAAQVTQMDRGIGAIMDCLEEQGELDNTVVFFLSDNGACSKELDVRGGTKVPTRNGKPMRVGNRPDVMPGPSDTWQSYGLSWANASNSPFRRFKKWLEEGGVATPFIASWPAAIKPDGLDTRSVLHVMDFMPTLAELAGAEYPRQFGDRTIRRVQGESFADLLVNPAAGRRKREKPLFWEHLGHRAARFGPWKVVDDQPAGDGWSLFDLRVDRTETHDVADDHPNIVGRLSRQWDRWKDRVGVRTYDETNGYGTPEDQSTSEDESALEDRAEASAS